MNDIVDVAEAILAVLKDNTEFPGSLSRRFSLDEGYGVQFELLKRRVAQGDVHVGWKVGLTSRAMQLQQGVHEPCLGHLVEAGHVSSPAVFHIVRVAKQPADGVGMTGPVQHAKAFFEAHPEIDVLEAFIVDINGQLRGKWVPVRSFARDSGNGLHVHFSVLDESGRNLFAIEDGKGTRYLHHAMGGLLATMNDAMAMFSVNANSFRRFEEGAVECPVVWRNLPGSA